MKANPTRHGASMVLLLALTSLSPTSPTRADSATSPAAQPETVVAELKVENDPTILLRRVWSDTEWSQYEDRSHDIEETLGGLWSWRLSTKQDWGVRLKLPYKWHLAGDTPGDSNQHGLGDIKLAAGTAVRLTESWRAGGGLEMRFPTATDDVLGDNVWQPQLFGAVAWDATSWLSFSPSLEYNKSIAEEDGVNPTHFLEMYVPFTFILPRGWAVSTRYETKVDFEADGEWTHSGKLAVSKQLETVPLGFSLSVKKTFDGGPKEFQVNFATTYFFR